MRATSRLLSRAGADINGKMGKSMMGNGRIIILKA